MFFFSFSEAVPIVGCLHLLDNAGHDLHKVMTMWPEMEEGLDAVCGLLCVEGHRELFFSRCISARFPELKFVFSKSFPMHIEWRWGSLSETLTWLLDIETHLKTAWNAQAFGVLPASTRKNKRSLNVQVLSRTIRSPSFWSFLHMCAHIQRVLESLRTWCEACPCHITRTRSRPGRRTGKEERYAHVKSFGRLVRRGTHQKTSLWQSCPVSGCRAPEMACGALLSRFHAEWVRQSHKVIEACSSLPPVDHTRVIDNWQIARSALEATLAAKLAHWQALPWKLFGVAHWDSEIAHDCARSALSTYDAAPDPARHHKLSNALLGVGSELRADFVAFAHGAAVDTLSAQFADTLLKLRFVKIVEREIEGRHAMATRALRGKKKKRSGNPVSLHTGRMNEFNDMCLLDADIFDQVACCMETVRNARQQCSVFGWNSHPAVAALLAQKKHHTKLDPLVRSIAYRCDDERKFKSCLQVTKASALQALAELSARKKAEKFGEAIIDNSSRGTAIRLLMQEHFGGGVSQPWRWLLLLAGDHGKQTGAREGTGCVLPLQESMRRPADQPRHHAPQCRPGTNPLQADDGGIESDVVEDLDVADVGAQDEDASVTVCLHCRAAHTRPDALRVPKVSLASGRRLRPDDVVISTHLSVTTSPDASYVDATPGKTSTPGSANAQVGILSATSCDPNCLIDGSRAWDECSVAYCLSNVVASHDVVIVVTRLVMAGAYRSSGGAVGQLDVVKVPEEAIFEMALRELAAWLPNSITMISDDALSSAWRLTDEALSHIQAIWFKHKFILNIFLK